MFWFFKKLTSGGATFVSITGDNSVEVSTNVILTATTDGIGTPVWVPEPSSGQGTLSATYNYAVLGRRNVTCTVDGVTSSVHALDVGFPTNFWDLADTNATIGGQNFTNDGVTFVGGKIGNCADNAGGGGLSIDADIVTSTPLTVALWVYGAANRGVIVMHDRSLSFSLGTNLGLPLIVRAPSGTGFSYSETVPNEEWVFLILDVPTPSTVKLYKNAMLLTPVGSSGWSFQGGKFRLGTRNGYPFYGKLDECMVFDRSLSQDEVNHLYNSGSGIAYPWTH